MRAATPVVLLIVALLAASRDAVASSQPVRTPDLLRYDLRSATPEPGTSDPRGLGRRLGHGMEGRSLAQADFDRDGILDLAIGLSGSGEGWIRIHSGRPLGGAHPFGPAGEPVALPAEADLLAAGDFDRDGRWDLVVASRSAAALWWLPGRGDGSFLDAVEVPLPGPATALAAGMIDVADGLDDLAVAVDGFDGPEVLVYRSTAPSFLEAPLHVSLHAPASALAIADLAGGAGHDLAVAAGAEVVIVQGTDRLVRGRTEGQGPVVRVPLPFAVRAVAAGDFLGRRSDRRDLAVLAADGRIEVLHWTGASAAAAAPELREGAGAGWRRAAVSGVARRSAPAGSAVHLLAIRQEASATDGLAVFAAGSSEAEVIALPGGGAATRRADGEAVRPAHRRTLSVAEPAAVLPASINADALTDLLVLHPSGELRVQATATGATFVVDSTGAQFDDDVGDGVCHTSAGTCTLWAAIQESEELPGADTIHFAINPQAPIGLPRTITYTLALQAVDGPLTLEGPNQGGAVVVLDGSQLDSGSGIAALWLVPESSGVVVRDLTITGFGQTALRVGGTGHVLEGLRLSGNGGSSGISPIVQVTAGSTRIGGTTSSARNVLVGSPTDNGIRVTETAGAGVQILGNLLGIEPDGTPNGLSIGIDLQRGAQVGSSTAGGGNVISGNSTALSLVGADGAQVWGNLIGTTPDGASLVGNERTGIRVGGGDGILVGGAGTGLGNVISGNESHGIRLHDQTSGVPANVTILGNRIGTDAAGGTAMPNGTGIDVRDAASLTIGGPGSSGNLVSGNSGTGIALYGGVVDATVRGNYVGTSASGHTAVPNGTGIFVTQGLDIWIGGAGPGEGNLISGNAGRGLHLSAPGSGEVTVAGNRIGVTSGGAPRGNLGAGIYVSTPAGVKIGGTAAPNEIAHNVGPGVLVHGGWGVDLRANSIYSNSELAIDLSTTPGTGDGVTANDPGDGDFGSNNYQNFPVLDAVFTDGAETRVFGTLESENGTSYRIDLYSNASCDPSGHGEARDYLGTTTIQTDAEGTGSFALTLPTLVFPGAAVSATATRTSPDDTSELSRCVSSEVCSGEDDRVVVFQTLAETETVEACRSITAHTEVAVTGDVTFRAGRRIVLGNGFSVGPGASFTAVVELP